MADNARDIFQENLKRIMKLRDKSQTDIAKALKIPLSTVSSWVNAQSYPRVDNMQKLADFLLVSMRSLTDEDQDTYNTESSEQEELVKKICSLNENDRKLVDNFIDSLLNKYPYGYDVNINCFTDPDGARVYLKQNNQLLPTMGEKPHELTDDDVCALATEYYKICKS